MSILSSTLKLKGFNKVLNFKKLTFLFVLSGLLYEGGTISKADPQGDRSRRTLSRKLMIFKKTPSLVRTSKKNPTKVLGSPIKVYSAKAKPAFTLKYPKVSSPNKTPFRRLIIASRSSSPSLTKKPLIVATFKKKPAGVLQTPKILTKRTASLSMMNKPSHFDRKKPSIVAKSNKKPGTLSKSRIVFETKRRLVLPETRTSIKSPVKGAPRPVVQQRPPAALPNKYILRFKDFPVAYKNHIINDCRLKGHGRPSDHHSVNLPHDYMKQYLATLQGLETRFPGIKTHVLKVLRQQGYRE